jgi:hypothetical protein
MAGKPKNEGVAGDGTAPDASVTNICQFVPRGARNLESTGASKDSRDLLRPAVARTIRDDDDPGPTAA